MKIKSTKFNPNDEIWVLLPHYIFDEECRKCKSKGKPKTIKKDKVEYACTECYGTGRVSRENPEIQVPTKIMIAGIQINIGLKFFEILYETGEGGFVEEEVYKTKEKAEKAAKKRSRERN